MNIALNKGFLYDWVGTNEWLFKAINSLDGDPTYNALMEFLTGVGEHSNFIYYFIAIAVYAILDFVVRKINGNGGAGKSLVVWIGVLSVFASSYAVDGLAVKKLKDEFAYPRPYVVIAPEDITVLGHKKADDDHHSFPSGHASFITVFICSLWPALLGKMPLYGALLIFAVCWSRIAMGMHFPADVIAGFLIALMVVLAVRYVLYTLFAKLFKWKC